MKDGITEELDSKQDVPAQVDLSYPGALELDVEKYLPYVEEFDMSEERKVEFLHALWSIMSAFVDLGWGVDSVHRFIPALKEFSEENQEDQVKRKIHECGSEFNQSAADKKGTERDDD